MMQVQYNRNKKLTSGSGTIGGPGRDVVNGVTMHMANFYFCKMKQKHSGSLEKLVHEEMDLMNRELHSKKRAGNMRHHC
jgi:hypothetical protein